MLVKNLINFIGNQVQLLLTAAENPLSMKSPFATLISRMFFMMAILFLAMNFASAQAKLDSLERLADELHGIEKLRVLQQVIPLYLEQQDSRQALRYAQQAERLTEDIIYPGNQLLEASDVELKPITYYLLGQAYQQRGQYMEGKAAYEKAIREASGNEGVMWEREVELAIQAIDSIAAAAGKTRKKFLGNLLKDVSEVVDNTSRDLSVNATLKLAKLYENNGNLTKAIDQYEIAANFLKDKGDWDREGEVRNIIADLMTENGQLREARVAYEEIRENMVRLSDSNAVAELDAKLEDVGQKARASSGGQQTITPLVIPRLELQEAEIAKVEQSLRDIRQSAEKAENSQDYKKSLDYYKQYLALEQQVAEEKRLQELTLLEQAHEIENRDREILLLRQNDEINQLQLTQKETELQKQVTFKRNLFGGVVLLSGLGFTLFLLYHNKRRDHHKLGLAYENLEKAKDRLSAAEHRVKTLLEQHLSGAVADELLAAKGDSKVERRFVCVMFLDIRDFTPFAEKLSPEEIIEYQNKVFGFMIDIINKHGGILNQIMGDGFMATFGAPVTAGNDCMEAYLAAQEIMDELISRGESGDIPLTRVGIGLHAGYVVTGNVGTTNRKQYSITGNPVIIAARLEQLNKEFGSTLVVSKEVYDRLPENVRKPAKFNDVNVKGRTEPVAVTFF